jgi:enoyl-CoA hydratase/carnithine racemase
MPTELIAEMAAPGVLLVTLSRPEQRNAWTVVMEREYFRALADAASNAEVGAVVLTGDGTSFCPGFDAARLDEVAGGSPVDLSDRPGVAAVRRFPKPLIAAVNGACAGIGLVHALLCDVRFVAEEARISAAFTRRGLAGERAVSWLLPRQIGLERALDLLLSSRTVSGVEAARLGLAGRVLPRAELVDAAVDYAAEMVRVASPIAMAVMREQVYGDLDRTFAQSAAVSDAVMTALSAGPDLAESVEAHQARRPAVFPPLPPNFRAAEWIADAVERGGPPGPQSTQ